MVDPDLFALMNLQAMTPAERRNITRKGPKPRGYAAPPGSGPQGETCRGCKHYHSSKTRSGKSFPKCLLMQANWTHGPGSDIRASSPACKRWEKP